MRRAVIVACALLMLVPALAVAGTPLRKQEPGRVPSARLEAKGSGMMTIVGRMSVNGKIPDKGSVMVIDRAGDAKAWVAGVPQPFTRGRVRVARVRQASGIVFVQGSNVTVQIMGGDLEFGIAGYGRARLLGSGEYSLNDGPEVGWTRDWIRIVPSPSSEGRRSRRCAECSSSAVRPH